MKMIVRFGLITAQLATGMGLPIWLPAAADSLHKAIRLGSNATVAGKPLQAGDYDLLVSGNQAKFERKGKVVGEVPSTWKNLPAQADHDVLLTTREAVTEIPFPAQTHPPDFYAPSPLQHHLCG